MVEQDKLRRDLIDLTPKDFYIKHIVKSHNWYFSDYLHIPPNEIIDMMDCFKEIVSINLGINFHNSQIVGSAKIGYSLSPQKLLMPFHNQDIKIKSSDIDIAIISEKLFFQYWNELRKIKKLYYTSYYNDLAKSIFRGYINDKPLTHIEEMHKEWDSLVSPVNKSLQDKLRFEHPITYRIYRNWDDLEEYQLIGISSAKRKIESEE